MTTNDILAGRVMPKQKKEKKKEGFWGMVRSLLIALFLALVFRTFFYEPFHIPSGSMKPTLLIGDYIFVSKFSYGYSSLSLSTHFKSLSVPFPEFDGRVLEDKPERGDVIVFKLPSDQRTNYIKRLVGFAGDEIQVKKGILYINGEAVKRERIEDFVDRNKPKSMQDIPQYVETLPSGKSYRVLDELKNGDNDNTATYVVPDGHYFFMGDNRDNSQDSRVLHAVGFVPMENLVGRAEIKFFSKDTPLWRVWRVIGDAMSPLATISFASEKTVSK